jgi:hypothetical protein
VDAKDADQRVHGVKLGITEKTYPQLKVPCNSSRDVHKAAISLPEVPTPERRFLPCNGSLQQGNDSATIEGGVLPEPPFPGD